MLPNTANRPGCPEPAWGIWAVRTLYTCRTIVYRDHKVSESPTSTRPGNLEAELVIVPPSASQTWPAHARQTAGLAAYRPARRLLCFLRHLYDDSRPPVVR